MENLTDIGEYIRKQREAAEVSLRELARVAGVSNPYLSQIERGLRKPSAEILQQIARGLSVSAETLYVKAGLLDDSIAETLTLEVIARDPEISNEQKQQLINLYESFISQNQNVQPQTAQAI